MNKFLFIFVLTFVAASALPGSAQAAVLSRPVNNLGLSGYWAFNDGSGGTAIDSSGNGNNGTLAGSVIPSWVVGKYGGALNFSGSGKVSLGTTGIPGGNSNYTISAWVKSTGMGTWGIMGWGQWATSNATNALRYNVNAVINYWWGNDLQYLISTLGDGTWHLVTATFDGTTRTIYVDGVYAASDTPGGSHNAVVTGVNIGVTNTNEYFQGSIDEVRVYSRALSSNEVAALYFQGGTTKIGMHVTYGLSGAYYDGVNFNTYVSTHTDSTVNFDPADSLGVSYANSSDGDTFSIRWTGYVKADYTGTYTFYTVSDDGARLYVNGSTVINSWIDQGPTEHSGTIALTAGQWYPIQLDFYENGGGATITLSWSAASLSKQIIPATNLKPSAHEVTLNTSSVDLQGSGLANGLVGLWTFDGKDTVWSSGTAGTATDRSGNGNTGTLTNMTQAGSVVIGKMGQALSFNGSLSYIVLPNNFASGLSGGKFTISAWVYANSLPTWGTIMKNWGSAATGAFHFGLNNTFGDLDLYVAQSNGSAVETREGSGTPLPTGSWQFVTAVADGSYIRLYRNGVAVGTPTSYNGTLKTSFTYTNIGVKPADAGGADSGYWNGKMDDVRLYSRALSAREVTQLYDLGK